MVAGRQEGVGRNQSHQFAAGHPQSQLGGLLAGGVEHRVEGGHLVVREVEGQLSPAVFLDVPTHSPQVLEPSRLPNGASVLVPHDLTCGVPSRAAGLPQQAGYLVGEAPIPCVQIDVVGDQELAGSDGGCSAARVELLRSEVGLVGPGDQTFVLPAAHIDQRTAIGPQCGLFVEEDRYPELLSHPPAQPAGQLDTFVHGDALNRYHRTHIRGTHPWVFALVPAHVDEVGGGGDGSEGRLFDGLG